MSRLTTADDVIKFGPKCSCQQSVVNEIDDLSDEMNQSRELLHSMNNLRLDKQLSDVSITVKGKKFNAHKLVLAAGSPYFKAMFTGNLKESKKSEITLDYLDHNTFELILNYVYTARIKVADDNVQSLFVASSFLQINKIQLKCSDFLKHRLAPNNCLGIGLLAEKHSCEDLKNSAMEYILKHFEVVFLSEEFLYLSVDRLIDIIKDDELIVSSEHIVYVAVLRWINFRDKPDGNRSEQASELMKHVRFSLMQPEYLVEIASDHWIKKNEKCRAYVDEAKDYMLSGHRRTKSDICFHSRNFDGHLRLYVFAGGSPTIKKYHPKLDKWTDVNHIECDKIRGSFSIVRSGHYLYSARYKDNLLIGYYDLKRRQSMVINQKTDLKRSGVSLAVSRGILYVIGGHNDTKICRNVYTFNCITGSWSYNGTLCQARTGAGVAVSDDIIYVVGGLTPIKGTPVETVEHYDPIIGSWEMVAPMKTPRRNLACVAHNGYIYAVGGKNDHNHIKECERYDPRKNIWESIPSMNECRSSLGLAVLGRFIYAVGGHNGRRYLNSVEVYDTANEK